MISGVFSGVVNLGRDNDARLLRLRTALELGTGFQLVLVEVEPGPIRREVIRRIQTWSGRAPIGPLSVISLDPDATLPVQLDGKSGAIVTGLEPPSPTEVPARDWIAELNWSRDALPELVRGPLVVVVSQAIHQGLFERAPDLYSWRRHTARVVITARELAVPLVSPGDRYWLEQRERLSGLLAEGVFRSVGRTAVMFSLVDVLLELGDERGASRVLDDVSSAMSSPPDGPDGPDGEDAHVVFAYYDLGRATCALARRDFAAAKALLDVGVPSRGLGTLTRGKLHAGEGAWDAAVAELMRALAFARNASAPRVLALAREGLCQVAFARGDIARARQEVASLIEVASAHLAEWGAGMLLRLAQVIIDIYPDEILPLLDVAFASAESSSRREAMIAIQGLRVRRAWLLERAELARKELTQAERWIRSEDPAEAHASLALCQAWVAMAERSTSEDEVAAPLTRACELFRPTAPGQSAVAGTLLAEFWRRGGRAERAVTAYQVAAADARKGGDLALAVQAELGELGAAVEGGIEQDDASDRLRAISDQFQETGHDQSEGFARAALGRCLLHRGLREAAIDEFDRGRACFAATTDAAREAWVARLVAHLALKRDVEESP